MLRLTDRMLRPSRKTKRRIFAALSINITCPFSAPKYADVNKTGGSILNANYPPKWVNFACLFTIIALGPSGTGKTHIALGLGLAACQKGRKVRFTTAAALVHELIEAVDERRLQRLQKQLVSQDLLIIDELGFVPLSKTGAELLFEIISQRYERGSIIITSNLPFDEWTEVFGAERLTGAILDRLTHHVHILEMNGESYRLRQSKIAKP